MMVPITKIPVENPTQMGEGKAPPFNVGLKYRLWDYLDFSISSLRGRDYAWSFDFLYNFGETKGFLPKIDDPPCYLINPDLKEKRFNAFVD